MGKKGSGKILKKCEKCRNDFYARHDRLGKYCSKSCASSNRPRINFKINKICLLCKKNFLVQRYRKKSAIYCSIKCLSINRGKMMRKESHPNWKGGISERPFKVRKVIKDLLKVIRSCQKCGNINNLQGHHIIEYSKRHDLMDDKNNILILCINCHAKEHPNLSKFILKGINFE